MTFGELNKGGGAIGAIIAVPMTKVIGGASYVVLIGIAVLLSIFTFGIKPAEIVDKLSEKIKEAREYDEEDDEDEEEIEQKPIRKKKKEKSNSVIMEDLFEDEKLHDKKKKSEYDIPLEFDEKESSSVSAEPEKAESGEFIEANLFKEKKEEKQEKIKQELQLEHSQVEVDENYETPPIALLEMGEVRKAKSKTALTENALKLQKTLHSFGVSAKVEDVAVGPAITRYELKPAEGVRVSKIANLADDIALNLAAQSIRIEAPIPRKTSSSELKYQIQIQKWYT